MSGRIVVVGSLNADFVVRVSRCPAAGETVPGERFSMFPGGKGANQAYAAAKLGARVCMVGQVGNDPWAAVLRENLASVGVDVSGVLRDDRVSSGLAVILVEATGQNRIVIVPGSNGTFTPDRLEAARDLLASASVVLLQLEIPLETVRAAAGLARRAGARVLLDPAPAGPLPDEVLAQSDYVTPNETELAVLAGAEPSAPLDRDRACRLARRLLGRGARRVLVKMGAAGALLVERDREHFWPAPKVRAVDTTAAGDAFNGAFAVALAEGSGDEEAGAFACAAAAVSVTREGAQPSMPTREEVRRLREGPGGTR